MYKQKITIAILIAALLILIQLACGITINTGGQAPLPQVQVIASATPIIQTPQTQVQPTLAQPTQEQPAAVTLTPSATPLPCRSA